MPRQEDAIEIVPPARPEKTIEIFSDGSMTVANAAAVFGMTPQGIRVWIDQGAPLHHRGSAGRGNGMRVIVADLIAWREDRLSASVEESRTGEYDEKAEKARERHHLANMRARDDRQQAGELVSIDAVAVIVEMQFAEVRAGIQNLPSRLATNLSAISDPREIRSIIQSEIHGILTALAEGEDVAEEAAATSRKGHRRAVADEAADE